MEFVQEKLTEWGLGRFCKIFKENEVDREALFLLDPDTAMELIPAVGPRMKFLQELENLKKQEMENGGQTDVNKQVPTKKSSLDIQQIRKRDSSAAVQKPNDDHQVPPKMSRPYDVRGILENSIGGKELIKEMMTGVLSPQSRKQVVATLVAHLIKEHGKYPTSSTKLEMAQSIVKEFPLFENSEGDGYAAWFLPGQKNRGAYGKNHGASGYLEARLCNVRNRDPLKEKKPVIPVKPLKSSHGLELATDIADDPEDENSISTMVAWLQNHIEPKEQVCSYMERTCKSRAMFIRANKTKSVQEIIDVFPRLVDIEGMIDQDFQILFGSSADSLFAKWQSMSKKVLEFAAKQFDWKKVLHVEELHSDEEKTNVALQVLPYLFPSGRRKLTDKGLTQRATGEECARAFIAVEKVGTNIPTYLEQVTNMEPHILIMGDRRHPDHSFVIVEGSAIPCDSLLKAVDICFKLTHVLDLNYSWRCSHTFVFLQKFVYGLGKDSIVTQPSVGLLGNYVMQK